MLQADLAIILLLVVALVLLVLCIGLGCKLCYRTDKAEDKYAY